ncbi:MAG: hypothetical protein J3R72DRAFT_520793 [Linnemannia gamsii]|nr:MAG: hypothetical protein J3R72DRAFT_520793 [Linnemannia gamsii]
MGQTTSSNSGSGQQGWSQPQRGSRMMTPRAASRIQSASDRNPGSYSASSGFKQRAQSSAAKNSKGRSYLLAVCYGSKLEQLQPQYHPLYQSPTLIPTSAGFNDRPRSALDIPEIPAIDPLSPTVFDRNTCSSFKILFVTIARVVPLPRNFKSDILVDNTFSLRQSSDLNSGVCLMVGLKYLEQLDLGSRECYVDPYELRCMDGAGPSVQGREARNRCGQDGNRWIQMLTPTPETTHASL